MNKTTVKELYNKISKKILHKQILNDIPLSKEFVKKHIENPVFLKQLTSMIENKDYSCQAVYALCRDILVSIDKEHNPTYWGYQVYQFILSKTFPE
ncbi:MAG: hypothetical protein PHW73_15300, partial [Atribacterota bacterium]|nr:hypothetical protein [Atribacterota bacterium]